MTISKYSNLNKWAIGATYETMQYLYELNVVGPRNNFRPFSKTVENLSGAVIGQGWAVDSWSWIYIIDSERQILKSFCSSLSSEVYIRTLNTFLAVPAWEVYRAMLIWSPDEDWESNKRIKFLLSFKLKEKITEET